VVAVEVDTFGEAIVSFCSSMLFRDVVRSAEREVPIFAEAQKRESEGWWALAASSPSPPLPLPLPLPFASTSLTSTRTLKTPISLTYPSC
jgi:hypothetical protein